MVHFADYIYTQSGIGTRSVNYLPGRKDGRWIYTDDLDRIVEKDKFEAFKTKFYALQGWDRGTGYPTRATSESLGLGYTTDELEKNGKLAKG